MPIETGGFATGLADGIFGALTEQRASKEKQNAQSKQETLKLLTSILPNVEPQSQPQLLNHIGEVMGLKGKQRGIWSRLTGADQTSDGDALRGKLSEILGQLKGPEAFKQDSPRNVPSSFGTGPGGMPTPTGKTMTPDNRQGIYLRDPQEDKLELANARWQRAFNNQGQSYQESLIKAREESQANLLELKNKYAAENDERDAENKAMGSVNALARRNALRRTGGQSNQPQASDLRDAIDDLYSTDVAKAQVLKSRIGLSDARTDNVRTETKFMTAKGPDGLPMGKPMTQAQRVAAQRQARTEERNLANDQVKMDDKADAVMGKYKTAYKTAVQKGQQLQGMYDSIKASGFSYDAKTGQLYTAAGDPLTSNMMQLQLKKLGISKLQQLQAEKDAAMAEMGQTRNQATTAFPDYFTPGANEWGLNMKPRANARPGQRPDRAQNFTAPDAAIPGGMPGYVPPTVGSTPLPPTPSMRPTPYPTLPPQRPQLPPGAGSARSGKPPAGGRVGNGYRPGTLPPDENEQPGMKFPPLGQEGTWTSSARNIRYLIGDTATIGSKKIQILEVLDPGPPPTFRVKRIK